jgi:hypothetical protein
LGWNFPIFRGIIIHYKIWLEELGLRRTQVVKYKTLGDVLRGSWFDIRGREVHEGRRDPHIRCIHERPLFLVAKKLPKDWVCKFEVVGVVDESR